MKRFIKSHAEIDLENKHKMLKAIQEQTEQTAKLANSIKEAAEKTTRVVPPTILDFVKKPKKITWELITGISSILIVLIGIITYIEIKRTDTKNTSNYATDTLNLNKSVNTKQDTNKTKGSHEEIKK